MKKRRFALIATALLTSLLILPALLAQTQSSQTDNNPTSALPAQMKTSEFLQIGRASFNKKIDPSGKGELLEVEFEINNLTDVPQELYIHVFATEEQVVWKKNTFYHAIEDEDDNILINLNKEQGRRLGKKNIDIRYFASDPDKRSNYEYEVDSKTVLQKYPKDKKAGVNPQDNQSYKLTDKIVYRNDFLCNYRKRYKYFNHVTILVFDDEEKLVYRQIWTLDGKRR